MSLRRPTVALLSFTFDISPLCGVALTPDCGIVILAFSSRGVNQTLVWHPVFILGFQEDYRPTSILFSVHYYLYVWVHLLFCSYASCLHLLYLMSELSCEYFHSTHLACWFGQMLTKAILWMKSSIASPTPRGVPVSPVRSWNWPLVLYTLPPPAISLLEPHSDARRVVSLQESYHPLHCDISTTTFFSSQ